MYRKLLLLSFMMFMFTGCAKSHYATENQDSVSLFLRQPDALHVQFASSIDKYKLHDTQKNEPGFWEINMPLPTTFSYFYVVDGSIYIPDCRFKETDDFGSENCIYQP